MRYLHHYETESAFNAAYNGSDYHEPWVSYTDETEGQEHVNYNKGFDFTLLLEDYNGVNYRDFEEINITPQEFCQEGRAVRIKITDPAFIQKHGEGDLVTISEGTVEPLIGLVDGEEVIVGYQVHYDGTHMPSSPKICRDGEIYYFYENSGMEEGFYYSFRTSAPK